MVVEKKPENVDMNIRLSKREQVKDLFADIRLNPDKYLFIHYSSESFNDNDGVARPLSISISNMKCDEIKTFSILNEAILKGIRQEDIAGCISILELNMLIKCFEYIKTLNPEYYKFLHWHMKSSRYGFDVLTLRYEALVGSNDYANVFDRFNKINIATKFKDFYGDRYIDKKRMPNLIKKNKLESPDMQKNNQELLKLGKYRELQGSFNARYEAILRIITLALEGRLKTNYNIIDRYGFNPAGIFEAIKDDWRLALASAIVWLFISIIVNTLFF